MNPWQVLGVEPGSDRKAIKRAYTRLLKDVHPEDRPDEFMQLRQAYEWALRTLEAPQKPMVFRVEQPVKESSGAFEWEGTGSGESPGRASATIEDRQYEMAQGPEAPAATIQDPWVEPEPQPVGEKPSPRLVEDQQDARQERLNRLVSAMAQLLDDPDSRNDLDRWDPLLMAPELNDFHASSAVGGWLLPQVIRLLQSGQGDCPLNPQVLLRLDERFHWTTDQRGSLPVLEDQLMRVCLLIEAAQEARSNLRQRAGWRWLGDALFNWRGRLSRLELLLTGGMLSGFFLMFLALSFQVSSSIVGNMALGSVQLILVYSLFVVYIKRVRDAGINPLVAIVVGIIFPLCQILFFIAAPKQHARYADPRLKYTDVYGRTYGELYLPKGQRPKARRILDRVTGIRPELYMLFAAAWAGWSATVFW